MSDTIYIPTTCNDCATGGCKNRNNPKFTPCQDLTSVPIVPGVKDKAIQKLIPDDTELEAFKASLAFAHHEVEERGRRILELITERDALKAQVDGFVHLRELHATDNQAIAGFAMDPAFQALLIRTLAEIVKDAPNYVEATFHAREEVDSTQNVVVTVQKIKGKTPNQKRIEAEEQITKLNGELELAYNKICEMSKLKAEWGGRATTAEYKLAKREEKIKELEASIRFWREFGKLMDRVWKATCRKNGGCPFGNSDEMKCKEACEDCVVCRLERAFNIAYRE